MIQTINANKIKGRMKEMGLSQSDIASKMGISQSTFNQKINNMRKLYLDEANKLSDILNIGSEDFGSYFFYSKSCEMQQQEA